MDENEIDFSSIQSIVRSLVKVFRSSELPPSHQFEAEAIVAKALKIPKNQLYVTFDHIFSSSEIKEIRNLCAERLTRKPLAYILGECEFYGLNLLVNESTLIPRSDTEILVETFLKYQKNYELKKGLEIGTGSGAIPLAILSEIDDIQITSTEIYPQTASIARKNSLNLGFSDRFNQIVCDVNTAIKPGIKFDFLVSNPPYVSQSEYENSQDEIVNYEPKKAFVAEDEGLEFYYRIAKECNTHLNSNAYLFFEHGSNQSEEIRAIISEREYNFVECVRDLNTHPRVSVYRKI